MRVSVSAWYFLTLGALACADRQTATDIPAGSEGGWTRVLRLDGGEHDFADADEAVQLSDGSVVVANRGEQELLWFSPTGSRLRRVGRRGSGPGEFRGLNSVAVTHGDTVLAFDGSSLRLTVLSPSGDIAATLPLQGAVTWSAKLLGVIGDGRLLFLSSSIPGPYERAEGFGVDSASLLMYDRTTRQAQELGRVPTRTRVVDGTGAAAIVLSSPIQATLSVAVCSDSIVVLFGDAAVVGWWGTHGGDQRREQALFLDRSPIQRHELDSLVQARRSKRSSDLQVRANGVLLRHLDGLRRPFFQRAALDIDGSVWLSPVGSNSQEPANWIHVGNAGQDIRSLPLPHNGRILGMTRTRMLVHERDADGVDFFGVYSRPDPMINDRCSSGPAGTSTANLIS